MNNETTQNQVNQPQRNWFARHPALTFMGGAVLLIAIIGALLPSGPSDTAQKQVENSSRTNQVTDTEASKADNKVENTATQTTPTKPQSADTKTEDKPEPTPSETVSQKNAVRSAKDYLDYSAFSHDGLVDQLEYEQFSHADAVYGADNSGADWNEQAAKSAKQYMEYSAFSRGSLIEQLLYEKFTQAQAEYGANAVGL